MSILCLSYCISYVYLMSILLFNLCLPNCLSYVYLIVYLMPILLLLIALEQSTLYNFDASNDCLFPNTYSGITALQSVSIKTAIFLPLKYRLKHYCQLINISENLTYTEIMKLVYFSVTAKQVQLSSNVKGMCYLSIKIYEITLYYYLNKA